MCIRDSLCDALIPDCDVLFLCAARVGGISANIARPGEFIRDNLAIQTNVIEAARGRCRLFVFFGSSCIYPRDAKQPITEDLLITGPLEPTNEPYAMAKLAGISMLRAYEKQYGMRWLCPMPCNLYGPGDHFERDDAHMIPALIHRLHQAKIAGAESVTVWGDGTPRRECMHVDDCAQITLDLVRRDLDGPPMRVVNVGAGRDWSVREIAETIARVVGYRGAIRFDASRPNGVTSKLMLSHFGPVVRPLGIGLEDTYRWYLANVAAKVVS